MKWIYQSLIKKVRLVLAKRGIVSFKPPLWIGGTCKFNGNTFLGKNTNFNGVKVIGYGELRIGDNFHSGAELIIITSNHRFRKAKALPYDEMHILKKVTIGDNVWVGERVTILPGVEIGEGSIIQAGAVIVKSVPALSIVGGSPAAIFARRDEKEYYQLKTEEKFH